MEKKWRVKVIIVAVSLLYWIVLHINSGRNDCCLLHEESNGGLGRNLRVLLHNHEGHSLVF